MRAASMSGAFTGVALNSACAFYNPGAMNFLERSQISGGLSLFLNKASYLSPYTGNTDMHKVSQMPFHLYGAGKLNENSAVGISINSPFHLDTKWPDDWPGRYVARQTTYNAVYVQPAYAYRISEKFSAGIGASVAFGRQFLSRAIPYQSESGEINAEYEGNSVGFGFNVGLFLQLSDEFSLGIDYRSPVKMKVNSGDASFSNIPSALSSDYPSSASYGTEYTLPSAIAIGGSLWATRELLISMDVQMTMWNVFDTISYTFDDHPDLEFGYGRFYKDAFSVRVGAQYKLSDMLEVRAGLGYRTSPVEDAYASPDNFDNDTYLFTCGGSLNFGEHFGIDIAYMLQNIKEREADNNETMFSGNYKSFMNCFGLTLNYRF